MILVFDLRILGFGFSVFVGLDLAIRITNLKISCWWVWAFYVCSYGLKLRLQSKDLGLGFLLWLWWFKAWAVVELVCLDFLVEVVVFVEGCWWVWIFDSFGFFGGGCGCVEGCWWWRLWLWIFGFAVGDGGAGFQCS